MTTTTADLQDRMVMSERIWALERQKTESLLQEVALMQRETARQMEETDRQMKETDRKMEETDRKMKETDRKMKETDEEIKKLIESQRKGFGGLRNSIGHVVEMVLLPGLRLKMNELGHDFNMSSPWKTFYRKDGNVLAEVDLFLENGDEVMVVEAKTHFLEDDVGKLIERVKKLRGNEAITGVAGKAVYAAAAGIDFTQDARRAVEANGIYLVEIDEDNDRVKVKSIPVGKVGKW